MVNRAVIISAPSGAGKTTLVKNLTAALPQLEFSVSACSRQKRENEKEGKDYYFMTPDAFREKIMKDDFIEWQEVYPGSYYGTLKSELNRIEQLGKIPIFDVDVIGGLNLKKFFGKRALAVFIKPPSIKVLESRLRNRGTETEESLQRRIGKALREMSSSGEFDCTVVNDTLGKSSNETIKLVKEFIS